MMVVFGADEVMYPHLNYIAPSIEIYKHDKTYFSKSPIPSLCS